MIQPNDLRLKCFILADRSLHNRLKEGALTTVGYLKAVVFTCQQFPFQQLRKTNSNILSLSNISKWNFYIWICQILFLGLLIKLFSIRGAPQNKSHFFGKVFPNLFTHPPQGFCEIWENERWNLGRKGNFRGDLGGFWGVWTLFGSQPPHPPTFGRDLPKKNGFFFGSFPKATVLQFKLHLHLHL